MQTCGEAAWAGVAVRARPPASPVARRAAPTRRRVGVGDMVGSFGGGRGYPQEPGIASPDTSRLPAVTTLRDGSPAECRNEAGTASLRLQGVRAASGGGSGRELVMVRASVAVSIVAVCGVLSLSWVAAWPALADDVGVVGAADGVVGAPVSGPVGDVVGGV